MFNIEIKNNKDYGLVVSSRKVAEELGKRHDVVLRDIDNVFNSHSTDLSSEIISNEYKNSRGQKYREYLLTEKGFTLYMFNIQGYNDFKMAYINEFERMKTYISEQPKDSYMIEDPVERAKRWIEEQEQLKQLEQDNEIHREQIEKDKPKVLFADTLSGSESSILVMELAKLISNNTEIKIGQNKLFKWLRENGFVISRKGESWNLPTQKSIDLGVLDIKKGTQQFADGKVIPTRTTKVTVKGQQYFINKFLTRK